MPIFPKKKGGGVGGGGGGFECAPLGKGNRIRSQDWMGR